MVLSKLAQRAIAYLIDGDAPRRWAYCPLKRLPGGESALAELLGLGLVEIWERPDRDAVTLTPYGAFHFGVEIDERWEEIGGELVEMPSWHGSPTLDDRTGDPVACWAHPIVQPREVGAHELKYPGLIPAETRAWYTDADGNLVVRARSESLRPEPAEVLPDQQLTMGQAVGSYNRSLGDDGSLKGGLSAAGSFTAFDPTMVRAYRKALKIERQEAKRARKRAKVVLSSAG